MRRARGFTLIELLAALFALALLAILSWRGLDGMMRAQQYTGARADEVLALQTGLAQWSADLEAIVEAGSLTGLEWNGRVLRLTRRSSTDIAEGLRVVGWARREGRWLRWQSPPLQTRGDVEAAWQQADQWALNPGDALRRFEVPVTALEEWQIFFYREDAWTNPLSSGLSQESPAASTPASGTGTAPVTGSLPIAASRLPEGVRLVLQLPPGRAISGQLTRDWVRGTISRTRS